jgi:hypothetical protein
MRSTDGLRQDQVSWSRIRIDTREISLASAIAQAPYRGFGDEMMRTDLGQRSIAVPLFSLLIGTAI